MSGMATHTPGMECPVAPRSGLPIAVGMALAFGIGTTRPSSTTHVGRRTGRRLDLGSGLPASASHHGLGNLICIVDINNQQADGPSTKVMGFEPLT